MLGSLKETINHDYQEITDFFNSQPEMYQLLDAMVISARGPIMATVENLPEDERSTFRYMLWRTMYDYVETSLLLLLKSRIDEGYALLRMAAELTRDIARISESQDNFEMWKNRATLHAGEVYKKVFRFNKNDAHEKHIFSLYNLASVYGVHSHQTRDAHLSHLGVVHGKYIRVGVPERKMLDALTLWLFSFFPLHIVAARTFTELFSQMSPNPLKHLLEMELKVIPLAEDIKKNIRQNYPKTT